MSFLGAQVLALFWLYFLVRFALYLQQFGTRTCHFGSVFYISVWLACLLCIVRGMFATFDHVCLPFCMVFCMVFCHVLALQPLICMVLATLW